MPLELQHYLASAAIGAVGSAAVLFASRMSLEDFSKLSERLFATKNVAVYIGLGGMIAAIVQSSSENFAPIFALATGAGWPAVIQGLVAARKTAGEAKKVADEQLDEMKDMIKGLP